METETVASLLGAILGGGLAILGGYAQAEYYRWRRRKSVRAALAMEIMTISMLIEENEYTRLMEAQASIFAAQNANDLVDANMTIAARSGYFTIYENSTMDLGDLPSELAIKIVGFYQSAKSILDTFSDENKEDPIRAEDAAAFYRMMAERTGRLDRFGRSLAKELVSDDIEKQMGLASVALIGTHERD